MAGKLKPKKAKATSAPRVAHVSPLARLVNAGALNVYEHSAADEIIAGYAMSLGLPVSRDASLGIPYGDPRPDAADDSAARRSDLITTYRRWRNDLAGTVWLSVAAAV